MLHVLKVPETILEEAVIAILELLFHIVDVVETQDLYFAVFLGLSCELALERILFGMPFFLFKPKSLCCAENVVQDKVVTLLDLNVSCIVIYG